MEWRWGNDTACLYAHLVQEQINNGDMEVSFGGIEMPKRFQGLPVFPMRANGVACIGKKPYASLLENKDCSGPAKLDYELPIQPPYKKEEPKE
jgi:hypothetical protein